MEKTKTAPGKAPDRLAVLEKIKEFEAEGAFDRDPEVDPPWKPLNPDKIDFLKKNPFNKLKSHIATFLGWRYFEGTLKKKQWILQRVTGLENLAGFKGGAMVTCNHFNRVDNYAVHLALRRHFGHYRLHKIVREGNYCFPGLVGFLLRNGDTIPIGEGFKIMSKATSAIGTLLSRGKKILIFPEQAMWWNYRRPRPLKKGAFLFAAKFLAPVIPCFITLSDNSMVGTDGFPVQEYTVHILPLIYPESGLTVSENCERMRARNAELWEACYRGIYE
ncbi:MAG: 1-acyl-sn-glycerol-3-phosphate acyltransferase [Firmicutes bacterium]|nr:1-acyl-sn-glycerol-3-phosphate acyltransferase [Bacillota bacterium]